MSTDYMTDSSQQKDSLNVVCKCPECDHEFDQTVEVKVDTEVEVTIET